MKHNFFLLNCRFSKNTADRPIYRVTYPDTTLNRPFNWGERYYFYNCSRDGEIFRWFENNLTKPEADKISSLWTFDGKWDPESAAGPEVLKYNFDGNNLLLFFNEIITVINNPVLKSDSNKSFSYHSGAGSNTIRFMAGSTCTKVALAGLKIMNNGKLIGTTASIHERDAELNF